MRQTDVQKAAASRDRALADIAAAGARRTAAMAELAAANDALAALLQAAHPARIAPVGALERAAGTPRATFHRLLKANPAE